MNKLFTCALCLLAAAASPLPLLSESRFSTSASTFTLDSRPMLIKAAELHYPRIPRPYWEHRIKMCKALGMNTICLYVFWNFHETEPGKFDFSGQRDLREFITLCQKNGMMVILRPGPYVCAEWEMGGLPWWLLKEQIPLRENDARFLDHVRRFEQEVAAQVADLAIDRGGPIIMVQVENEYGSYGKNKPYVAAIRDMLRELWGETTLFQCDWSSNFLDNALPDLLWTLNFGTGADINEQFAPLRRERPDSPLMCSEFWSGWYDKWGTPHETRPASEMVSGISDMLSQGISFSLYMTHGGSNPGHWAGANDPGYLPLVASYDYDAPINEQGSPTPKYHALRALLASYADEPLPEIPDTFPVCAIPEFRLTQVAPLLENLPAPIADSIPRNMEAYGQGFGSILYSSPLPADIPAGSLLSITGAHDFTQVFAADSLLGTLDRRLDESSITLPSLPAGTSLCILVEATGRINFGRNIADRKGITGSLTLSTPDDREIPLKQWQIYLLPDDYDGYASLPFQSIEKHPELPRGIYRGTFTLTTPADTYLSFETWGKGLVYVNGHPLGRIWQIGPQLTLYTPGCYLRPGENELMILDITGPEAPTVSGRTSPLLDSLKSPR